MLPKVLAGTIPYQLQRLDGRVGQLQQLGRPGFDGGDLGVGHLAKVDEARRPLLLVGGLALPVVLLGGSVGAATTIATIVVLLLLFLPSTVVITTTIISIIRHLPPPLLALRVPVALVDKALLEGPLGFGIGNLRINMLQF